MTRDAAFPFFCTMNTFAPEIPPAEVIEIVARLGFVGCDLSCDGLHFPYSAATVLGIRDAVARCGITLGNVNTMTTAYFWRDHGDSGALASNRFRGPDITDHGAAYADLGVPDSFQWRLDRIEGCLKLASALGVPLFNMNVGSLVAGRSEHAWRRVLGALRDILSMAEQYGVQPCIETEVSQFVGGRPQMERILAAFPAGSFCWGYDVGHQIKYYRGDHDAVVRDIKDLGTAIGYFHVEDIARADWEGDPMKHRHLAVGEGDINFAPIFDEIRRLQTTRIAQDLPAVPVYYENYHSFDRNAFGSSGASLDRMRDIAMK